MTPIAANDEELSCALERAIEMCQQQMIQAEKHWREDEKPTDIYHSLVESREWSLALIHLLAAQRLRVR